MSQRFKRSKKESKKLSIKEYNKRYAKRMKELMPDQFTEEPTSLEEKIDKELAKVKEEQSKPDVHQLRPYYLGKQRALEWILEQLRKDDSA